MKTNTLCKQLFKAFGYGAFSTSILLAAGGSHAAAQNEIAQVPPSVAEGVPPNMLFTLDDSGSMRFAFAPDNISDKQDTRRAKSSHFNPIYYNPDIKYEIPPFFDSSGKEIKLSTSFSKAYNNGFNKNLGFVDLATQYRVSWDVPITRSPTSYKYTDKTNYTTGTIYRLGKNPKLDFNSKQQSNSVAAYYYTYNPANPGCNNNKDNDACYTKHNVSTSEQQNFAIWYSFYRNRALATLSAAAVAYYNLSPDVRLSWQALNNCKAFDTESTGCGKNKFQPYSTAHRGSLYSWLSTMKFDGGTPLRLAMDRAGKFLQKSKAWDKDLLDSKNNSTENTYACRPSYHILMTDGMWNGDNGSPSSLKPDHNNFDLPDGKKYTQSRPYADSTKNTLADIAMHYWATDLNPSLENKIRPYIPYKNDDNDKEYWDPRNNPAEWQSMSNFIVGLALTDSLSHSNIPWSGSTHGGPGYKNLLENQNWPAASADNSNNVYDLWHAAINSRGEFYSVDSPEAMIQAFQDILTRIAERKSSAAMPGTSSAIEVFEDADGNKDGRLHQFFYQTTFNSADGWSGDLTKTERYREYNETTKEFEWVTKNAWSAAAKLPAHGARKIYMANSTGNNLIEFTAANSANSATYNGKTLDQHLAVNPEPGKQSNAYTAAQRLDYLRGSDASAGEADDKMRERSSKLGDFLGSSPVVVGNQGRYLEGFSNKLEENEAYTAFLASIQNRKAMVYVGGNAGMLHAFNAETGVEEFAFVPTAVFPYLNKLTGKGYTHQYYVDGTPTVADIYDKENGKWRTILVGTLRAGGKGLFALDITDPENISLLWEFHEYSAEAVNLAIKPGYSFPKPTVARLHNGSWAVVTGNGYKGEGTNNGGAALYIIDAITGKLTKSLEVTGETGENGLSTPRLVDFDGDGVADYAYAGDLQGNLWRFDLLGGSASGPTTTPPSNGSYGTKNDGTSKFQVSYNGSPMFKVRSANGQIQPITSAPSVIRHPTRLGYLVVFGTGRYVEIGDKEPNKSYAQSLYGIWDTKTKAETTGEPPSITRDSNMTQQSFVSETSGTGATTGTARQARTVSNNPVEWYTDFNATKPIKQRGWYLDFNGG